MRDFFKRCGESISSRPLASVVGVTAITCMISATIAFNKAMDRVGEAATNVQNVALNADHSIDIAKSSVVFGLNNYEIKSPFGSIQPKFEQGRTGGIKNFQQNPDDASTQPPSKLER